MIWMTFLIVVVSFYGLFGSKLGIVVNKAVAHQWWFRLHLASGTVVLFGLAGALATGQQLHVRDIVTAALGLGFLASASFDRLTGKTNNDKSPTDTVHMLR